MSTGYIQEVRLSGGKVEVSGRAIMSVNPVYYELRGGRQD